MDVLLQEYDFEIVYRPGRRHVMADHLSRINNGEPPTGVPDQFPDAQLFAVRVHKLPNWRTPYIDYLLNGHLTQEATTSERQQIAIRRRPYTIMNHTLMKLGPDGIQRVCVAEPMSQAIIAEAHKGLAGGHFGTNITLHKILTARYWWPTMQKDVYNCGT